MESVKLSEIPEDFAQGADELSPPQKAQFRMTYWVLSGAVLLLLASGGLYVFAQNGVAEFASDIRQVCGFNGLGNINHTVELSDFCKKYLSEQFQYRNSAAKDFFDFCKNFVPPIVTLVLGAHYVTKSSENSNG